MDTIITSIISAASVLLAALIPILINKRNSSSETKEKEKNEILLGEWNCEWWNNDGTKCADDDMPFVHFTEISNGEITGTGMDKNGRFDMKGPFSKNSLTLTGSRPDKSGGGGEIKLTVVVDKVPENRIILNGVWEWRDTFKSKPYGGKTKWTKSI